MGLKHCGKLVETKPCYDLMLLLLLVPLLRSHTCDRLSKARSNFMLLLLL